MLCVICTPTGVTYVSGGIMSRPYEDGWGERGSVSVTIPLPNGMGSTGDEDSMWFAATGTDKGDQAAFEGAELGAEGGH